jgi:hypothetical protein
VICVAPAMSDKATIVGVLGEKDLLLPGLVHQALAANGRAKYFLTLLQLARAHADALDTNVPDLRRERELAGIADERFDTVIGNSRRGHDSEYRVPLAKTIVQRLLADIEAMIVPLRAVSPARFDEKTLGAFERRLSALSEACSSRGDETIASDAFAVMTS